MILIDDCEYDESDYFSLGWSLGPPRGIIFHLSNTASYDVFKKEARRNGSSSHFYVPSDSSLKPIQMVDLENRSWHAHEASNYYFGIVHECIPGQIHLTIDQLKLSAQISARILEAAKEKWGVTIPIIRAPGPGFSPGFKDHKDGLGSDWNKNMHTDGLIMTWTWNQYLDEVKFNLEDDDMALFDDKTDFRNEIRKALVGSDKDGNPNLAPEEVYTSLQFIFGMNLRLGGSMRPSESGPKQRGWDMADAILKSDDDSGSLLRRGKLTGVVTFGDD